MDIFCSQCGEPWDIDTLHDVAADAATSVAAITRRFREQGCAALSGAMFGPVECSPVRDDKAAGVARHAWHLLGEDLDGVAAACHDHAHGWW